MGKRNVRRVEKRPEAENDLREIWFYTFRRWGEKQADLYIRTLDAAMERLSEVPGLGVDYGHVRPSMRKQSVERHRIFYYVTDTAIDIIRVLHMSMDTDEHLGED